MFCKQRYLLGELNPQFEWKIQVVFYFFAGDRARLYSAVFDPSTSNCQFIFYFHLTDQTHGGGLYFYYQTEEGGPLKELYRRQGTTNDFFQR